MGNKIEKYKLENRIRNLRRDGKSFNTISSICNELLPEGETISSSAISYFFRNSDESNKNKLSNIDSENSTEKLKLLETKVWLLLENAEELLAEAKFHIKDNPQLFDRSVRSTSEVIKTCLLVIKEMKEPATQLLNIDIRKQSINCLLEFTSDLDDNIKESIQKKAETHFLNGEIANDPQF